MHILMMGFEFIEQTLNICMSVCGCTGQRV